MYLQTAEFHNLNLHQCAILAQVSIHRIVYTGIKGAPYWNISVRLTLKVNLNEHVILAEIDHGEFQSGVVTTSD